MFSKEFKDGVQDFCKEAELGSDFEDLVYECVEQAVKNARMMKEAGLSPVNEARREEGEARQERAQEYADEARFPEQPGSIDNILANPLLRYLIMAGGGAGAGGLGVYGLSKLLGVPSKYPTLGGAGLGALAGADIAKNWYPRIPVSDEDIYPLIPVDPDDYEEEGSNEEGLTAPAGKALRNFLSKLTG